MLGLTERGCNAIKALEAPQYHEEAMPSWMMLPTAERYILSLLREAGGEADEEFVILQTPERYGSSRVAISELLRRGLVEKS